MYFNNFHNVEYTQCVFKIPFGNTIEGVSNRCLVTLTVCLFSVPNSFFSMFLIVKRTFFHITLYILY